MYACTHMYMVATLSLLHTQILATRLMLSSLYSRHATYVTIIYHIFHILSYVENENAMKNNLLFIQL